LTSITAWRAANTLYLDTDVGPSDVQDYYFNISLEDVDDEQFTQELRLGGNSDRWTWVGGMYFLWGSHDRYGVLDISAAPVGTAFHDFWGTGIFTDLEYQKVDTTSLAFFGQGTYSLTDTWSVTGGLRYTYDEKDMHSTGVAGAGFFQLEDFDVRDKNDWDAFTPMASIQGTFEDTGAFDSLFVFTSVTRGYKAGGYNVQAGTAAGVSQSVEPEYAWSYEAGVKTRSLGDRLGINVVVFHQTLEDLQTQVFEQGGTFSQENAGETVVDGVEFELSAAISQGFDVGLAYSWMDAEYDVFIDDEADFSGNRLPQAPETTYSVDAAYVVPVGNGELSFRANFSHSSWVFITPRLESVPYPIKDRTERDTLDAFLTYEGERWSIGAYGRNLTDDRPITFALDSLSFGWLTQDEAFVAGEQAWAGRIAPPREVGITIGWRMQ
jgi:iron complex outermembrane receptor protein